MKEGEIDKRIRTRTIFMSKKLSNARWRENFSTNIAQLQSCATRQRNGLLRRYIHETKANGL